MKKLLVRFLTKYLFHWVSEDDIFKQITPGVFTHKRKELTQDQLSQLSEDARIIKEKYLWKVLQNEIKYASWLHWLTTGEDLSARMLLRAEEIIRKTLDKLEGLSKK